MSAYCPHCETDLDPATGICPACRWDPYLAAAAQSQAHEPTSELTLTERYRGSRFDVAYRERAASPPLVSRGRAFVMVTLVAGAALYAVVVSLMGPLF